MPAIQIRGLFRRRAGVVAATLAAIVLAGCATGPAALVGSQPSSTGEEQASTFGNYLAGRLAHSERDTDAAAEYYAAALASDPTNQDLIDRAFLAALQDGRMKEALALAPKVRDGDGNHGFAALALGVDALARGQFAAARARFEGIREDGALRLLAPIMRAWSAVGAGDTDRALADIKALAGEPRFKPFQDYAEALINDLGGRPTAALESYGAVMSGAIGRLLRAREVYGVFLERNGRADEARRLYADGLQNGADNAVMLSALERLKSGRLPAAAVGNAVDGAAESFNSLASLLTGDNMRDAAVMYLHLALHLRPGLTYAQIQLGEILSNERRWQDAIALFRSVPADSPFSWIARLQIARALDDMGRTDEAIVALKGMADEQPNRTDALTELGDVLRRAERFGDAATVYDRVISQIDRVDDRHWTLFYTRGIAYERSKQWRQAEADFLRALELKPDQPLVLNYLGYSWVEQGTNLDRARKMIERAVELRPNDGYIVDSLGWVLYRLGDYAKAVGYLERAIELNPGDPVINDHLGDAYWRVGRRFEARFQWRRALSFKPSAELVPAIEKKLEAGLVPNTANSKAPRSNGG